MIGTAFSVLIRLELAAPGVQILNSDHQLFNGAPFYFIVHSVGKNLTGFVSTQGQPNPIFLYLQKILSLKATILASLGKLNGENSMVVKLVERILASYISHGEVNESLKLSMLVQAPDLFFLLLVLGIVGYLFSGNLFYVETGYLIWSGGQVAGSNPKERRHLKEYIGGQFRNAGSPDKRNLRGDGGFVLIKRLNKIFIKGSRGISTNQSLPAGFDKLGKLSIENLNDLNLVNTKMLKFLSDTDILLAAQIKLNSSSDHLKVDEISLDGLNISRLNKLQKDLNTNKFQFKPIRTLEISKANGLGTRVLGLASARDNLVLRAILLILEAIFDPCFSVHSHGFRPKKGCHSALGEIKRTYTAVN